MSDAEKRMKPYTLAGFLITIAGFVVVFAILVVFLVLFVRQVPIGALVFTLVLFALLMAALWKPFQWWLKLTHTGEVYKDGRWQPMRRRGKPK